jgi:hypothetical protein
MDSDPSSDPSGILDHRAKGIFITLSSPMPLRPWWEQSKVALGEALWIEDQEKREEALAQSLPPVNIM